MTDKPTRRGAHRGPPSGGPPLRVRLAGRAISLFVARVPRAWPLLRPAARRFWNRRAEGWDARPRSSDAEYLAPCSRPARSSKGPPSASSSSVRERVRAPLRSPVASRAPTSSGSTSRRAMVERARGKVPPELSDRLSFSVEDAGRLSYDDGSFDLVAQLNVPVYFDEVARVLRPSGRVIVASSFGPATPYYTPLEELSDKFAQRGVTTERTRAVGTGDYFLGCGSRREQVPARRLRGSRRPAGPHGRPVIASLLQRGCAFPLVTAALRRRRR
jgi:Methyltransferase domain